MGHGIERRRGIRPQGLHGVTQGGGLLKTGRAADRLFLRGAECKGFLNHEAPAADGHEQQKGQDALGHKACLRNHAEKAEFHACVSPVEHFAFAPPRECREVKTFSRVILTGKGARKRIAKPSLPVYGKRSYDVTLSRTL